MTVLIEKAQKIKCLISDVDGVLTDGLLYIDNLGNELKAFHVQDGMGLKLLICADIEVAIITTSNNKVIDDRMAQLGIRHYYKGQVNKLNAFQDLKNRLSLNNEDFAYVGDDLPDISIIQQVGLGIAVNNAREEVKKKAIWQTECKGGQGAIREVCDFILQAQGKHEQALERYLG
jgi:3-deoxy-D-manno-octulosonate 8-phosphate phosphatase (KDO 8-P phosphatase)